jgi:8-oxo-dGTP diphosphatase
MVKETEIASSIVFDTSGRLLLQLRDDIPGIVHPGKIGLFGGHREMNETFLDCVVRELNEELSYFVPPERFEHIAGFEWTDGEIPNSLLRAEFFVTREIPVAKLKITEGTLKIIPVDELDDIADKLTPAARFGLETFFGRKLNGPSS